MAGDEQLELDDDLNVDETAEIETESFPDPDLDVEPEVEESAPASSMEGAEANLPTPPAPPIPEYAPPVDDGGFTPVPTYQQDAPARQAPPAQPQVQFYSVAQLTEAVNNGIITEDQKIEQLQLQNRELAKREALQAFEQQSRQQSLTQQLSEYSTLVPGWDQIGTEANKRASAEYKVLLGRGLQEDNTTKLLALERAFGPAHRIKEIRATQARTAAQRDTTQEVGRRGSPPPSSRRKDPLTVIPLEEKRWYKDKIDKGIYKNWDEVRAEIQWAATQTTNPRLRDKHAGLMK
jgi:hypothetical protein